jgi:hypothetical protein
MERTLGNRLMNEAVITLVIPFPPQYKYFVLNQLNVQSFLIPSRIAPES